MAQQRQTAQDELDRKLREIAALEAQMDRCPHSWGADIKYVPRETGGYEAEDTMFPRPPYPKVWIEKKIHPRWSRRCVTCGKVQHTERTKSIVRQGPIPGTTTTEQIPDFAEERRPTLKVP